MPSPLQSPPVSLVGLTVVGSTVVGSAVVELLEVVSVSEVSGLSTCSRPVQYLLPAASMAHRR